MILYNHLPCASIGSFISKTFIACMPVWRFLRYSYANKCVGIAVMFLAVSQQVLEQLCYLQSLCFREFFMKAHRPIDRVHTCVVFAFSDDLTKLKYLTMCIKEALRIHATVPIIQRETNKDMTICGRDIPAGTVVNVNVYALHHSKEVWNDPEEYQPDRFSLENLQKMDPYAFCPFSAGSRSDIKAFIFSSFNKIMGTNRNMVQHNVKDKRYDS